MCFILETVMDLFIIPRIQCLLNVVIFPLGVEFFEQTANTNFLNFCWVDLRDRQARKELEPPHPPSQLDHHKWRQPTSTATSRQSVRGTFFPVIILI